MLQAAGIRFCSRCSGRHAACLCWTVTSCSACFCLCLPPQANVHFEKASVLFNVAAVMSQQALQVDRGTPEGATQACKIFQVGCWVGFFGGWGVSSRALG